ncbi:UPF0058 family protein [Halorutilales archaeon Cl-col2-1]|nr:UPF0058 family protein [Halobacteria archaeon]
MHKDELIHLHSLMVEVRKYFEENENVEGNPFEDYDSLGTSPVHIHKSKSEHKHAIFVLGEQLAETMSEDVFSETGRVGARMEELAEENAD